MRCALRVSDSFHRLHSLKPGYRRRYFHYLVPLDEAGEKESAGWEGRMMQFEKSLSKEMRMRFHSLEKRVGNLQRDEGSSESRSENLSSDRERENASLERRMETMEKEIGDIHAKLEELLSLTKRSKA